MLTPGGVVGYGLSGGKWDKRLEKKKQQSRKTTRLAERAEQGELAAEEISRCPSRVESHGLLPGLARAPRETGSPVATSQIPLVDLISLPPPLPLDLPEIPEPMTWDDSQYLQQSANWEVEAGVDQLALDLGVDSLAW